MWFMNPRLWIAIAALAAMAGAFGSGWHLGSANVRADLERLRADHATKLAEASDRALAAERHAREAEATLTAREQALAAQIEKQSEETRREKQALADDAAAARRAADSLRKQLATIATAYRQQRDRQASDQPAAAAGKRQGLDGAATLDLLADLLAGRSSDLAEVAAAADALRLAGLSCERAYDQARAARVAGWP